MHINDNPSLIIAGCAQWKLWAGNTHLSNLVRIKYITNNAYRLNANDLFLFSSFVDQVIQKKRREYSDPNSTANMKRLNDDLQSIHNVMRKTIDDVLDRGNKLDGIWLDSLYVKEFKWIWWWTYKSYWF